MTFATIGIVCIFIAQAVGIVLAVVHARIADTKSDNARAVAESTHRLVNSQTRKQLELIVSLVDTLATAPDASAELAEISSLAHHLLDEHVAKESHEREV